MRLKDLDGLSRTAVKTRVHWLDEYELVSAKIGVSKSSPADTYHLLRESSQARNVYADGYATLCGNARRDNLLVLDTERADIAEHSLCQKCARKKREMLKAANALQE